ncbi:MAG: 50S ribosomal protein L24 [Dehalococcoidia bacterium]|nr:50S ribosomal protein L24 [Dehalococcoidia bacterium]
MAERIKKGDSVIVLSGRDKGKKGTVDRVLSKHDRVIVTGVNMITRHLKQRPGVAQAGRIQAEGAIHASKVMLVDTDTTKPGRVGWKVLEDGTKVRMVKSGKRS